jgi:hypothetical protein
MSDWSDTRNITGQDVKSGVFWKPEKPSWNLPSFGKDPLPAAPQQQRLSRDFNQANEFVALLRKEGPRAAYARFGAADINSLFDAAVGYGLMDEGERESIWAAFNAPAQTGTDTGAASNITGGMGALGRMVDPRQAAPAAGGVITDAMIARSGGAMNAYDNAWAAGNMAEPKQKHFKSHAEYKKAYELWLGLH